MNKLFILFLPLFSQIYCQNFDSKKEHNFSPPTFPEQKTKSFVFTGAVTIFPTIGISVRHDLRKNIKSEIAFSTFAIPPFMQGASASCCLLFHTNNFFNDSKTSRLYAGFGADYSIVSVLLNSPINCLYAPIIIGIEGETYFFDIKIPIFGKIDGTNDRFELPTIRYGWQF